MFNQEESRKLWGCTGKGAAVGGVLCGILFVWTLFADLWNCLCDCLSSSSTLPEANSFLTYLFVFIISVVIGFIVGYAQASSARNERLELEEQARQKNDRIQRQKYASDIKNKAQTTLQSVYNIQNKAKEIKEEPPLVSVQMQENGWTALSEAQNEIEEIKVIISELNKAKEEA